MRGLLTMIAVVMAVALAFNGCGGGGATSTAGWEATVYYTAVERFHTGATTRVTGCVGLDCENGRDDLGTYPKTFVQAVQNEGTGRTTAGKYLNWSHDVGYWLDVAPRDAAGRALVPWVSAAADPDVLKGGTTFTVVDCGRAEIDPAVCAKIMAARWTIVDEFTPGLGGERHIDLYIGEETQVRFEDSPWYTTLEEAKLRF